MPVLGRAAEEPAQRLVEPGRLLNIGKVGCTRDSREGCVGRACRHAGEAIRQRSDAG